MELNRLKSVVKSVVRDNPVAYKRLARLYTFRDPHVLQRYFSIRMAKDSRFDESELAMASLCPTAILDAVIERWNPRTFLDIGCGTGQAMEYLSLRDIECTGLEGSIAAIKVSSMAKHIHCVNLNKRVNLGRKYDVVWSYEVAEHIHPKYVDNFLLTLTGHGDVLVMSAAQPGQGGTGHFNEQPASYWIDKVKEHGLSFDDKFSEYLHSLPDYFSRNMMAFIRI